MPSRKQRRREAKNKRHEYEFVYVDGEGNELDEVPEELLENEKPKPPSRNGSKATPAKRRPPAGRARRKPPEPSWNRAVKRSLLLGAVVFVLFSFTAKGTMSHRYVAALIPAVIYTALFIPFTFAIDRFAYRRWQAREQAGGGSTQSKTPAKKR
jgi:hypothetical protein